MSDLPDLTARIKLDTRDLDSAVGRAAKSGSLIGSAIGSAAGGLAANGIAALGRGLIGAFKGGLDELGANQKAFAQFDAGLQKSGATAGVTRDKISALADSIEAKTGTDGAAVVSGAALLLTFSKVKDAAGEGNDAFTRATQAGVDLAARGFGSVEGNAISLGKALNDPIKGIAALGRSGITFSEDQKKTIAALVKTGDTLGAQKIILGEVENQVKGSAEAYGNTLPGRIARGKAALEGIEETVVKGALPALVGIGEVVNAKVLPALGSLAGTVGSALAAVGPAFDVVKTAVARFAGVLGELGGKIPTPVLQALGVVLGVVAAALVVQAAATAAYGLVTGVAAAATGLFATSLNAETGATERGVLARLAHNIAVGATAVASGIAAVATGVLTAAQTALNFVMAANPFVLVAIALAALVAGIVIAYKNSETFREIVSAAFDAVKTVVSTVLNFLRDLVVTVFDAIKSTISTVLDAIKTVFSTVFEAIKLVVTTYFDAYKLVITTAFDAIKLVVTTVFDAIKTAISAAFALIKTVISAELAAIKLVFSTVFDAVKAVVTTVFDGIKTVISGALEAVKSGISTALSTVSALFSGPFDAAKTAVGTALTGVITLVTGLPARIVAGLGNLGSLLLGAGGDIVRGLATGIGNAAGEVIAAAIRVANAIKDAVKGALGISSPSRVMMKLGAFTGEGFALGIEQQTGRAQAALAGLVDLPSVGALSGTAAAAVRSSAALSGSGGAPVSLSSVVNVSGSISSDVDFERILDERDRELISTLRAVVV